nr:hypothetical protein [Methylomonas methanica]
MYENSWWFKSAGCDRFLDPGNYIVSGAPLIVAKVVIEAYGLDITVLQKRNDLVWPICAHPALGCGTQVIKINADGHLYKAYSAAVSVGFKT